MSDILTVLLAVLTAAGTYAYVMWKKSGEAPQLRKILPTFLIGVVVAVIAWRVGISFDIAEDLFWKWPCSAFVVGVIDQGVSDLLKRIGWREPGDPTVPGPQLPPPPP